MIVASNSSPIINLAAIGHLYLLKELYEGIIIPEVVYHEIVIKGAGQPGCTDVDQSNWIKTQKISDFDLLKSLKTDLDEGEAESIALAIEKKAHLLLMDERIGRAVARKLDIDVIGLLGILILAKKKHLIEYIKPLLNDLRVKAGF